MKRKILFTVGSIALIFALSSCQCNKENNISPSDNTTEAAQYICPMNCESGKAYDKSGQCPVCGMDLVKK